jgi:hypothetical protein
MLTDTEKMLLLFMREADLVEMVDNANTLDSGRRFAWEVRDRGGQYVRCIADFNTRERARRYAALCNDADNEEKGAV